MLEPTTSIAGQTVRRLGLGCFPLTGGYGSVDQDQGLRVIRAALDAGIAVLDTSDAYAAGANEELVGRAVMGRRSSAVICTKFGWILDGSGQAVALDSSPSHVRAACEASLRRLRTDHIDVYIQHRQDPKVAIEDTIGELGKLLDEGKIRAMGLSEVAASTLARADAVRDIAVLQTEYSLWSREPEGELLPRCAELGVTFMAYSPLGRGFLTGAVRSSHDLEADDFRRGHPRFQDANLRANLPLVSRLAEIAARRRLTTSQLALAWLLSQPSDIVPIPATRSLSHLHDNVAALDVELTPAEVAIVSLAVSPDRVQGARHPAEHMKTINQ